MNRKVPRKFAYIVVVIQIIVVTYVAVGFQIRDMTLYKGEIYDFNGKKAIAIGGAYSIDKYYRLSHGWQWFESEQADEETMRYVEAQLDAYDWQVDYVLTHTVPIECEPVWAFIPGIDQSGVDKTMEKWLQQIMDNLEFEKWYAGHYHVESDEDGVRIMFEDYEELGCE